MIKSHGRRNLEHTRLKIKGRHGAATSISVFWFLNAETNIHTIYVCPAILHAENHRSKVARRVNPRKELRDISNHYIREDLRSRTDELLFLTSPSAAIFVQHPAQLLPNSTISCSRFRGRITINNPRDPGKPRNNGRFIIAQYLYVPCRCFYNHALHHAKIIYAAAYRTILAVAFP